MKLKDLKAHPIAEQWPIMPEGELGRLEESMRQHGFDPRFPIVLFQDQILDGRNRWMAVKASGVDPIFQTFTGTVEEAEVFARLANEERRHLTPEWLTTARKERIARVAEMRAEGKSTRAIAKEEKVSQSQVVSDLKASAEQGGCSAEATEVKIVGLDGKTQPATKPPKPPKVLCDRCARNQRTGQPVPKSCDMCREANGKKPKKPKAETNPTSEVVDAFKNAIPKKLKAAYCDPWIQETIDLLGSIISKLLGARVADGMNKRAKHYPFFVPKDFIDGHGFAANYLQEMLDHLKEHRPAGVCPACSGAKCTHCKESGLVPREIYKKLKEKK